MSEPLLRTEGLTRHFKVGPLMSRQTLHAVDDVDLTIGEGEIVALVGESGSGKSTIARLLALIYRPTKGEIYFRGKPVSRLRSRKERLAYSGEVPMVFQDPYSSINPAYRVSHGIMRGLKLHRTKLGRRGRREELEHVLGTVGLVPAQDVVQKYPYELSGGQRQRIGFAQALGLRPKLIVADEPVSMLDVSIRIGILNLMTELREREDVLQRPKHPYTQLLLSAVPDPKAKLGLADTIDVGEPPRAVNPTPGCRFWQRCPRTASSPAKG